MKLQLLRFPNGSHYQASGEDPWTLDERREVEPLRAQLMLADFPGCFALVVETEPAPETVGPAVVVAAVVPAPPAHTAVKQPKRKG